MRCSARGRNRDAVEEQADRLQPLRVAARGETLTLTRDLLGDRGDGAVDERRDRAGRDVKQLTQFGRIGSEAETDLRPPQQRHRLPGGRPGQPLDEGALRAAVLSRRHCQAGAASMTSGSSIHVRHPAPAELYK